MDKAMQSASQPVTVKLTRCKECKVRFETTNDQAPVTNVYLSRAVPWANSASVITVTIEETK